MNGRQLAKLGVPEYCTKSAIAAIQEAVKRGSMKGKQVKRAIQAVVENPSQHVDDEYFGAFAKELIEDRQFVRPEPIEYRTWGDEIDNAAHGQMKQACGLPMAVGAALMPDAHVGYGLPIGGVLALENAVVPYAVGVDIACRMKLSILDMPTDTLDAKFDLYKESLESGTRFGVGCAHETPQDHAVMDDDWAVAKITRVKKDLAWSQLGTSGSGNHFVEFGVLSLGEDDVQPGENQSDVGSDASAISSPRLGLKAGKYVALMSHSGSRGVGASVCSTYSSIARSRLPRRYEDLSYLAWLSLDSEEGQEYWAAMNLMGRYASANHDVIHRLVSKSLGAQIIGGVENHHNFAWKETHGNRELIVHRKGATPAGKGVLGVIPGSMADPAFIVRGKGKPESLASASHGAGRCMSRRKANQKFNWKSVRNDLEKKGVRVLSAGADESPGVYKNIENVMREQSDLVEIVARFDPKIVKMCGDGSKAED